jgi:hypothetical protein
MTCFESWIIWSFEALKVVSHYDVEHSKQLGNIHGSHCCHFSLLHNFWVMGSRSTTTNQSTPLQHTHCYNVNYRGHVSKWLLSEHTLKSDLVTCNLLFGQSIFQNRFENKTDLSIKACSVNKCEQGLSSSGDWHVRRLTLTIHPS